MLFQNDDQVSKLKELTKISGGKVWSDRPKLIIIIVCHLIRIDLPNYYSLYYFGWISEMLGTGGGGIIFQAVFVVAKITFLVIENEILKEN